MPAVHPFEVRKLASACEGDRKHASALRAATAAPREPSALPHRTHMVTELPTASRQDHREIAEPPCTFRIFQARPTTFSFEFFPPKTDKASEELFAKIAQLQTLQPSFVSVTYGAGGSTRERTHDLIVRIQRETT